MDHLAHKNDGATVVSSLCRDVPVALATGTVECSHADKKLEGELSERKQAERALAERAAQMQSLRAVTMEIAEELDLAFLLSLITRRAAELIGATSGVVYLWEEHSQVLAARAWTGLGEWMTGMHLRLGDEVAGAVAKQRNGMIVNDYRTSPFATSLFLERSTFTAIIAEPLLYHGEVVGVITVNNEGTGQLFNEQDHELLTLFATHAAITVQNARLHTAIQRKAERIEAINRLSNIISSSLDLRPIYRAFATEMKPLIRFDRMGIVIPDESGKGLQILTLASDRPNAGGPGSVWSIREGTGIDWVMSQRRPHIEPDLAEARLFVEDEFLLNEGIRSSIRLPIIVKGQVIGALFLDSGEPHCYSGRDLELLVPLGQQLAIAIENARLYAETHQRGQEMTKLYEVTRQLASSLELYPLLDQITVMVLELLGTEASGIYVYDAARGGLVFSRGLHMDPELTKNLVLAPGEGISGRAFLERRPVWSRDRFTDPSLRYTPAAWRLLKAKAPRASLGVPIISRDEVYGVLMAYFLMPHDFTPKQVQLLSALADHAAIAIDNARLHTDLGESMRKVEELYSLSVTMQEQTALEERLELILMGARTVLGFDRINILLANREGHMLKAVASIGGDEPLDRIRVPLGLGGGGIARAFLERKDIVWDGAGPVPDEWRLAAPYSEIRAFRSRAFVNMPLIVRGEPIGVLGADNRSSRKPITAETVRLLKAFAAQAALAIDNARLYDEVSGYAKGLEQKVEERTKALKESQVQLIQSGKLAAVGTLAAGVAHELNQPLMVIRGYAQELLEDERITDAEIRTDLGEIEAQTTRMVAIITHLRDFSRQSKGKRQVTDLNRVVTHAFSFLSQQLKARNITVVQALDPNLPQVWADPLQIEQVLLNLATNARDAMEAASSGTITIRTEVTQDGRAALTVTDTGPGIPRDLQARIFDPFFTTKEAGKGTGLGLSICHGIIEEHGGELRVESPVAAGRGARFAVLLSLSLRDPVGRDRE